MTTLKFCDHFTEWTNELRVFEVDSEAMLEDMQKGAVSIKGASESEAVLCTSKQSFVVRLAESTNTLLFVSPNGSDIRASCTNVYELRPCGPPLQQLQSLLEKHPYCGPENDDDDLGFTMDQLSALVQWSNHEIPSLLHQAGAICVSQRWRSVHPSCLRRTLRLLLASVEEAGLSWSKPLPKDVLLAFSSSLAPAVVNLCVEMFFSRHDDDSLVPNVALITHHVARDVASKKNEWRWTDLASAVADALPPDTNVFVGLRPEDCYGWSILEEKAGIAMVRPFSLTQQQSASSDSTFQALFAEKAVWPMEQLVPFVRHLTSPTLPLDQLLLRYCFINNMDPKKVTVSKR